jgi:pimeloyl-ACP methyl ester carboxylesterase
MSHTIVLVHGAFADSSSWNGVIDPLQSAGHPTVAAANPLRSLASDAEAVSDLVRSIDGPIVLVAHSYGGSVITNVAADAGEITGLVYVNGLAPDAGESAFELAGKYPGSTTGDAARPTPRSDGTTDLALAQELFRDNFCADLPAEQAARMAATQRPATLEALQEPSGDPLWKQVPSWFLIGGEDHNLPPALHRFMAERADARRTVEIPGASHAISISQPEATADLILEAAAVPVSA